MSSLRFACVVVLALGSGCALLTKSEPVVPRYFSPESAEPAGPRATETGLELRLGRVNSDAYIRDRIVHRDSDFEIGYYDDRVWTDKPEAYVRRALARALFDERGVTQRLSGAGTTLDVDIVAFEEVRAPAHVARIKLVYAIYDDRVVRLSRSIVIERPILPSKDDAAANEIVQAISLALATAVETVADATASELRSEEGAATKVAQ
jgi:cholesterol transport system auxiliary component